MNTYTDELDYLLDIENIDIPDEDFLARIDGLGRRAFVENNETALLTAHRVLYNINLAHLAVPWQLPTVNPAHPLIAGAKYRLEQYWEQAEQHKYTAVLQSMPEVADFPDWIKQHVQSHPSNVTHPIFTFLRDEASFAQLREFFLQETPLEMLFGDIIAMMMPGVYGSIKLEMVKNFWDEVGHAKDEDVHRNLRGRIMKFLDIPVDFYIKDFELLVTEELALINMYLSLATNRSRLTELVGILLATELMIPGRFEYQIEGWRRLGVDDETLRYLIDHTTVDVEHANDWLDKVVMTILHEDASKMPELVLGVFRRLDTAGAVCERLYSHLQNMDVAAVGYHGNVTDSTRQSSTRA